MKRLGFALALVACALVVTYQHGRTSAGKPAVNRSAAELQAPEREVVAPQVSASESKQNDEALGARAGTRVALGRPESVAAELCVVKGRAIDENGAGMAGVYVSLSGYKGWAENSGANWFSDAHRYQGFEMLTDAAGAFQFEVTVPTSLRTSLKLKPDRFHDSYTFTFGATRNQTPPALVAGVRDMGEIVLWKTGVIRGRVVDEQGIGLGGVKLTTGDERWSTFGRGAVTDVDGAYSVEHARVGTYLLVAKLDGFLNGVVDPVTVEAGLEATQVDLVLMPAPSLSGIVLDNQRVPIEGAKITCWPLQGGSGAWATTGNDGRFVVVLPQDEEFSLDVEHAEYRDWDRDGQLRVSFMPGSSGIEVVLENKGIARARITVIDLVTKQPVEDFGIAVVEGYLVRAPVHLPQIERHVGGVVEVDARSERDSVVVVADGYLTNLSSVYNSEEGLPEQTIGMDRGRAAIGRVLRAGVGEAGAEVVLSKAQGSHKQVTDAAGRFRFEGLRWGSYRLKVTPVEGAPLVLEGQRVFAPEVEDLGDLVLLEGGNIHGEVLLPPGIEPEGLTVVTGNWSAPLRAKLGSDGRFAFTDVAPGGYLIYLAEVPKLLSGGAFVEVSLGAGETAEVIVDARDDAMCEVQLTVEFERLSAHGVRVSLVHAGTSTETFALGTCDREGKTGGFVRAWGAARVRVIFPGGGAVIHPDVNLDLVPGTLASAHVKFSLGELRLALSPEAVLPQNGSVSFAFEPINGQGQPQKLNFKFRDSVLSARASRVQGVADSVLFSKALLPGSYRVTAEFKGQRPGEALLVSADGLTRLPDPVYFTAEYDVMIVVGKPAELQL